MKVLVFTSLFPNNVEPNKGVFIKERMVNVAKLCEVKVIAPVPYFPPIKIFKRWYPFFQVKKKEVIEGLEVFRPRFFIVPKIGMVFYGLFMFLSVLKPVKTIQKEFNFDLIDAHYIYPDGIAAVLLGKFLKKPVVVSVRGTDINFYPKFTLIRKQIIYTLKNAAKIISVCQALKDKMVKLGILSEKIEVIPNGVDIEKFKPFPRIKARKELNLPIDQKIILSVGHLVKRKGFQYLIDALSEIKNNGDKDSTPTLVIVGEGLYRFKLENQIKELHLEKEVRLIGAKPHNELYKWYGSADLFCLASFREGWPNVIFESLACGTPVVATNVDGIPEVICSEDYGILVDEQDSKKIAQAIIKALDKNWDIQKLVKYAQENTWNKVAQKVHSLHQSIMLNTEKEKSQLRTLYHYRT